MPNDSFQPPLQKVVLLQRMLRFGSNPYAIPALADTNVAFWDTIKNYPTIIFEPFLEDPKFWVREQYKQWDEIENQNAAVRLANASTQNDDDNNEGHTPQHRNSSSDVIPPLRGRTAEVFSDEDGTPQVVKKTFFTNPFARKLEFFFMTAANYQKPELLPGYNDASQMPPEVKQIFDVLRQYNISGDRSNGRAADADDIATTLEQGPALATYPLRWAIASGHYLIANSLLDNCAAAFASNLTYQYVKMDHDLIVATIRSRNPALLTRIAKILNQQHNKDQILQQLTMNNSWAIRSDISFVEGMLQLYLELYPNDNNPVARLSHLLTSPHLRQSIAEVLQHLTLSDTLSTQDRSLIANHNTFPLWSIAAYHLDNDEHLSVLTKKLSDLANKHSSEEFADLINRGNFLLFLRNEMQSLSDVPTDARTRQHTLRLVSTINIIFDKLEQLPISSQKNRFLYQHLVVYYSQTLNTNDAFAQWAIRSGKFLNQRKETAGFKTHYHKRIFDIFMHWHNFPAKPILAIANSAGTAFLALAIACFILSAPVFGAFLAGIAGALLLPSLLYIASLMIRNHLANVRLDNTLSKLASMNHQQVDQAAILKQTDQLLHVLYHDTREHLGARANPRTAAEIEMAAAEMEAAAAIASGVGAPMTEVAAVGDEAAVVEIEPTVPKSNAELFLPGRDAQRQYDDANKPSAAAASDDDRVEVRVPQQRRDSSTMKKAGSQ